MYLALFHSGGELPHNMLAAWSFPVVPFVGLVLTLAVYLRGWWAARRTREAELPPWRAISFMAGLVWMWLAIASPIDALDDDLLAAHMIQHFILMSIAPPLIMLGAPAVPLLRGLPQWVTRHVAGPILRVRGLHRVGRFVTHPATAWLLMNVAYLGWHVPAMFELTFRSEAIHDCEHACFFFTSLGFWWVVISPWPAAQRWPRWTVIPYLLSADILNTILSATLAFAGRVLYPSYAAAERVTHLTALQDQVAAGAEMWVLNSTVMLVPAFVIMLQLLQPGGLRGRAAEDVVTR